MALENKYRTQHYLTDDDFVLGNVETLFQKAHYDYEKAPPDVVSWERGEFAPFPTEGDAAKSRAPQWGVFRIRDGFTFGRGIVARPDGIVYPGSLGKKIKRRDEGPSRKKAPFIGGQSILATVHGTTNYGHWLVDILPRVNFLRREMGFSRANVIIHERSPGVVYEMLQYCGVPRDKIIAVKNTGAVCEELILCSLWSNGGNTHRYEIFDEIKAIQGSIKQSWWKRRPAYPERVFLAREDASTRFVLNGDDLSAFLGKQGYEKFNTGALPLLEQIKLFEGARDIVAVAGASLTNMIFCKPGYRLTVLAPDSMSCVFFWDVAHYTKAGSYKIHYGIAEDPDEGIRSNFSVDIDKFWAATVEDEKAAP